MPHNFRIIYTFLLFIIQVLILRILSMRHKILEASFMIQQQILADRALKIGCF